MDEFEIAELVRKIKEEINSKEWYDLTSEEIHLIDDPKKQNEYIGKAQKFVRHIINPLYNIVKPKKHEITKDTCKGVLEELIAIYKKRHKIDHITKENICNIIIGNGKQK